MDGFDIAAYRRRKRITQNEMRRRVGLSTNEAVGIERNRLPLTPELEARLIRAIDEAAEEKQAATA